MRLYQRKAILTVHDLEIPVSPGEFWFTFDVQKSNTAKQNTASFKVRNLTKDHRDALMAKASKKGANGQAGNVRVRLEAGYEDQTSRIFDGDLRVLYHQSDGPDVTTIIESGDGDQASFKKIFKSWEKGTPAQTVLRDMLKTLGSGLGNFDQVAANASFLYAGGTAKAGSVLKQIEILARSAGLSFSIQDGVPTFTVGANPLPGTAVVISPSTGLVGSPALDHKGVLSCKTLMIPDLFPNRKIKVESAHLPAGFYKVTKTKHSGDSYGTEWYIDLEAKRL